MKKRLQRVVTLLLVFAMVLPLAACSGEKELSKNSKKLESKEELNTEITGDYEYSPTKNEQKNMMDFSVRLFQNCVEKDVNTLISPLSVMVALSMVANGAKGSTLEQMEDVLGLSAQDLNVYFYNYSKSLPQGKKYKLQMANSIWFRDSERFTVEEGFLQTNKAYYQADIYKAPFDDTTVQDINLWVNNNTDGMIKEMLQEIPEATLMYIINAVVFDAKWQEAYEKKQVKDREFTMENGVKQKVKLMYSEEGCYLEDENATGFMKYYADKKYAFVALLPKDGVSVVDYVAGMSGEKLQNLLNNWKSVQVDAAIPQFEMNYDILMNDALMKMGMTDAFDGALADFSGLGTSADGNISINNVLQKTYIEVSPEGTRAAAVTAVDAVAESEVVFKTVHLDRPFVYMLIDCENKQPFFMGTMMSVEKECGLE